MNNRNKQVAIRDPLPLPTTLRFSAGTEKISPRRTSGEISMRQYEQQKCFACDIVGTLRNNGLRHISHDMATLVVNYPGAFKLIPPPGTERSICNSICNHPFNSFKAINFNNWCKDPAAHKDGFRKFYKLYVLGHISPVPFSEGQLAAKASAWLAIKEAKGLPASWPEIESGATATPAPPPRVPPPTPTLMSVPSPTPTPPQPEEMPLTPKHSRKRSRKTNVPTTANHRTRSQRPICSRLTLA